MCGIVGYIGSRNAYPILIKGLQRLEYRGYDSAGCALISDSDNLNIYKAKGKVSDLQASAKGHDISGTLGIAHTRWATHGAPSEVNAHPHLSQTGKITLVHNGIIENYATLREQLKKRGYDFKSETDTEVLVQLIQYQKDLRNCSLEEAVRRALRLVVGAYAIAVIDADDPDKIVAARKSSPLAVGVTENNEEFFLASDASPIAEYTNSIVYVNDEEVAVCERGKGLRIVDLFGKEGEAEVKEVDVDLSMLDHEGYPHFMLKEIFDQPEVLKSCMSGRIINAQYTATSTPRVELSAVTQHRRELLRARRIIIISCGTSWHAGLIGKQYFEHFCELPCEVCYASEFRYADPVILPDDVVIPISQSGETADTLAAIQLAKQKGAFIYGIVNGVGSSIARESHTGTYIHVGPEIGVASTKAFTGQVMTLLMIALAIGQAKGTVTQEEYEEVLRELVMIPGKIGEILKKNDQIKEVAQKFAHSTNFLYLGRGYNYPIALEGALKLKEISYIHAEGYPAAEMKHGPIALIDEEMPIVFLTNHHRRYQKVISNLQEVISRKGHVIAITSVGDTLVRDMIGATAEAGNRGEVIEIPDTISCLAPLLSVIPLQLMSYHIAVAKGLDVDKPRNLAKSVTVE